MASNIPMLRASEFRFYLSYVVCGFLQTKQDIREQKFVHNLEIDEKCLFIWQGYLYFVETFK